MPTHTCLGPLDAESLLCRFVLTGLPHKRDDDLRQFLLGQMDDEGRYECAQCWRMVCSMAIRSICATSILNAGGRDKAIAAIEDRFMQTTGMVGSIGDYPLTES